MKKILFILPMLALCACATPVTMLKSANSGQVVRCGGDRSGAIAGGLIGYSLQSNDAAKCVQDYAAQGYKIIPTAAADPVVK